jgi:hypothetical protein
MEYQRGLATRRVNRVVVVARTATATLEIAFDVTLALVTVRIGDEIDAVVRLANPSLAHIAILEVAISSLTSVISVDNDKIFFGRLIAITSFALATSRCRTGATATPPL